MTEELKTVAHKAVVSVDDQGNTYVPDRGGFDVKKAFTVVTEIYNEDEKHQKQGPAWRYGFEVCYDIKKLPKNQKIVKDLGDGRALVTYRSALLEYKDNKLNGNVIEFGPKGTAVSFARYENGHKVENNPFKAMDKEEAKPRNDSPATLKHMMLEALSR